MFEQSKKTKIVNIVCLAIYCFLTAFIIFESCLPRGLSEIQSKLFTNVSSWFVNLVKGNETPKVLQPLRFGEVTDSSYLPKNEDETSNIAIGTTTLIRLPVQYPIKGSDYSIYNYEYSLSYPLGNKDDYEVVLSSRIDKNIYYIDMRIVANDMGDDLYQLDLNISELTYSYKFHIVELAEPTNYECRINKTNLKIGETSIVETKLLDDNKDDAYLKRYLDINKINRNSSNETVASIDKHGVIHALSYGMTTITFGKYQYDISVLNDSVVNPITSLELIKDSSSKENPSLLDYDYVFDGESNSDEYGVLVKASFSDISLLDKTVNWEVDDSLKIKLAPYKYDSDGYPIYVDDDGNGCVRVCGYRKKGDVKLTCVANYDNSVKQEIVLNVDEALPNKMKVNISNTKEIYVNEQTIITASFGPKNVNNHNIHIEADTSLVNVKNNDTSSVIVTGLKSGKTSIKVSSLANPDLVEEVQLEFTAKSAINKDNYNDFHLFIRKALGHFLLFMLTASFGMLFFYLLFEDKFKIWVGILINLGCGLFTAGLSELIQHFIPSRTGSISDVGVDFLGYAIGTGVTLLVLLIIHLIKKKKQKSPQKPPLK